MVEELAAARESGIHRRRVRIERASSPSEIEEERWQAGISLERDWVHVSVLSSRFFRGEERIPGMGTQRTIEAFLAAGALVALACGGPKTISKDGYRALLVYSPEDRFQIAVRGEKVRVSGTVDGSEIVKIVRPDLTKSWQFRPSTRRIFESPWLPTDEAVPGYPLAPGFDPEAYADRFGGVILRIDDATHGLHPCERYRLTLPSGDVVTIWVARDLERLVVRIEHAKKDGEDEYQPFTDTQLLDVKEGAAEKLFDPPEDYEKVDSYEKLSRGQS
jgi:hypothetical protein